MITAGTLKYTVLDTEYEFGTLTNIEETFSKSGSTFPIVSQSYKDTFAIETSSAIIYSIRFVRVQPKYPNDKSDNSNLWSNKYWYTEIVNIVNRWQAQTDGGVLSYVPSKENPYVPEFSYNGYIKNLTMTYTGGRNTEIAGTLEFHVGRMFVNTYKRVGPLASVPSVKKDDFLILMSDANQTTWYPLLRKISAGNHSYTISCVSKYTLYGGIGDPFEHATLVVPREYLSAIAPELDIAANIMSGKNRIVIEAVGRSSMYLANCSLSDNEYKLEAYCDATVLKDCKLDVDVTDVPFAIIEDILGSGNYGVAFRNGCSPDPAVSGDKGVRGNFVFSYFEKNSRNDELHFLQGEKIWDVLQVCATYLGCKLFFANGNAYLIDYRDMPGTRIVSENPAPMEYSINKNLNLHTMDKDDPAFSRVIGNVEIEAKSSGLDSVVNAQPIRCLGYDEEGEVAKIDYREGKNQDSVDTFGRLEGDVLDVPGIFQSNESKGDSRRQADVFVKGYLDYRAEPQQSVRFTFKEMQKDPSGKLEWAPFFEPTALLGSIESPVNNINVSNISVLKSAGAKNQRVPQKLILTQFERNYPKGTTTYTFGQIGSIDLSSSTSQIMSNLNSV